MVIPFLPGPLIGNYRFALSYRHIRRLFGLYHVGMGGVMKENIGDEENQQEQ